jgi:hypothetical protein
LEQSKSNIKDAALTVGVNAVGVVGSAYALKQSVSGMSTGSKVQGYNTSAKRFTDASGKFTSAKDLPKSEMIKKFMDFAVKAQSKGWIGKLYGKLALRLGQSIAIKAAAFIGGLTVPGIGTAVALISLASLAYDAYNIYEAIFGENGILDELEKEDKLNNVSQTPPQTPTDNTTPTPAPYNAARDSQAANPTNTKSTPATSTPAAPSTTPTPMAMPETAIAGGIDPSKTTFNDLTKEQQDIFMQKQREAEGFKPGSLTYDLNNPGAMLYAPWQKKYGAELDTTGRGVGTVKGLFARFPTLQDGVEAQRALLSGEKYGNLPLEQAINQWVTGNKFSDVDTNMGAGGEKNTSYKNKIYAALGAPPATSSGMPTTVASASQSARPTTVASASMPSLPSVPSLMPTMPNFGDMLMGATADFSDTMRMIEGLVNNVTNITNNSTQASAGGGQQSQGNLPSVYDDVFLNLFQRVT